MTTWSKPDADGDTMRTVGHVTLQAREYGDDRGGALWTLCLDRTENRREDAPDLASAQAAADAAVEAIYAAMGADLGLVFGPWFGSKSHAVAPDGQHYMMMRVPGGVVVATLDWGAPVVATEDEAKALARAHDAARRGTR